MSTPADKRWAIVPPPSDESADIAEHLELDPRAGKVGAGKSSRAARNRRRSHDDEANEASPDRASDDSSQPTSETGASGRRWTPEAPVSGRRSLQENRSEATRSPPPRIASPTGDPAIARRTTEAPTQHASESAVQELDPSSRERETLAPPTERDGGAVSTRRESTDTLVAPEASDDD